MDSRDRLSVGEWMALMSHLGFFTEPQQISYYEAKLVFSWSRIRTAKDREAKLRLARRPLLPACC